jgi:endonuclease/exonuclease/phosphatase family metal-dependent hydrolase
MGSILTFILRILTYICLFGLLLAYLCPFVHPSDFWIIPFFGLAYPIILLCTIFALFFWIFKKSRLKYLILVILLIGGKLHFRTISLPTTKEEKKDTSNVLKIASYNVRLFDLYDWANAGEYQIRDSIFDYLHRLDADVVCFQEFYHQDKPTKFKTRDSLKEILASPFCHEKYSHKLKGRQNFGIALMSKYPILSRGDVIFDDPLNIDNNYCIFADILKGKDTFRIYNVHLQSIKFKKDDYEVFDGEHHVKKKAKNAIELLIEKLKIAYPKRADQARVVVEHMKLSPYPTIVCGDFNDTPMSYSYNIFNKLFKDAFRNSMSGIGPTYAGKIPAGRIDYIFYSKELHSSNFTIQNKALSDHFAISCEIWK